MSGWAVVVRQLYDASGPLRGRDLGTNRDDVRRAKELGLIALAGCTHQARYQLTDDGRDYIEGRLRIVFRPRGRHVDPSQLRR